MAGYYSGTEIDLSHYWRLIKSAVRSSYQKVLVTSVVVVALAFLFTLTMQPEYRATAVMHIAPPKSAVFDIQEIFFNRRDPAFRETQVGILKSRALLNNVVESLKLHQNPLLGDIKPKSGNADSDDQSLTNQTAAIERISARLQSALTVTAQRESYLYNISVTLNDAALAAEIANTLAKEYILFVQETEKGESEQSDKFLQERLVIVNKDLRTAEQALQEFKEEKGIVGSSQASDGFANQELDLVSQRLLDAKQKRLEAEALYQKIREIEKTSGDFQGIQAIKNDALIQSIRSELVLLESQRSELSKRYGPAHQKIIEINSQIGATNFNLKKQINQIISGLKSEYELAKQNEERLKQTAEQSRTNIQSLGRKQYELLALEQEVQSQREIYQMILGRLNQSRAAGVDDNTETFIVDPAVEPVRPVSSKGKAIVFLAGLMSLIAGFGIALLGELFNNTIKIDKDVESKLLATCLGIVPKIGDDSDEEITHEKSFRYFLKNKATAFAESIRTIRSSLLLSSVDLKKRKILFTSSLPGEGKTVMAVNTAIAFGKLNKTLLIDCDLRRPSIDSLISKNKQRQQGLSDVCSAQRSIEDCIVSLKTEGIDVLCAGSINPNPQELFCSNTFNELLTNLGKKYDVIVIDSPPSLGLSDASLIAALVDQVVFVVKSGVTPVSKIRSALMLLKKANATVTGIVVNQVMEVDLQDSYYYDYGYGSYEKADVSQS